METKSVTKSRLDQSPHVTKGFGRDTAYFNFASVNKTLKNLENLEKLTSASE